MKIIDFHENHWISYFFYFDELVPEDAEFRISFSEVSSISIVPFPLLFWFSGALWMKRHHIFRHCPTPPHTPSGRYFNNEHVTHTRLVHNKRWEERFSVCQLCHFREDYFYEVIWWFEHTFNGVVTALIINRNHDFGGRNKAPLLFDIWSPSGKN